MDGLLGRLTDKVKQQYQQGLLNQVINDPASIGRELGQLFDPQYMSQVKPMTQEQALYLALNAPMMAGTIKNANVLNDVIAPYKKQGLIIDAYLSKNKPEIIVSKIQVPKDMRNKGIGTNAMQDIINYANDTKNAVSLSPSTDFGASSVGRLKDFYKKLGFVENKGRNKDFTISETMYYKPKE